MSVTGISGVNLIGIEVDIMIRRLLWRFLRIKSTVNRVNDGNSDKA